MKTIKDITKKFRELPSVKYLDERIRKEQEQFIKDEITELLDGLKRDELKRYKKGDFLEHRDEYNFGSNDREIRLREDIKKIIN